MGAPESDLHETWQSLYNAGTTLVLYWHLTEPALVVDWCDTGTAWALH